MYFAIQRMRSFGWLAVVLFAACGNTEGLPPVEQDAVGVRPDARDVSVQPDNGDEDTLEDDTVATDDTTVTTEDDATVTTEDDTSVTTTLDTDEPPEDTVVVTDDTVAPPDDTVVPPEDTTVAPPEDTVAPPEDTTVAPPEDTFVVPDIVEPPPPRHPMITEASAKNDTLIADGFGDNSDWIEIYNPHDVPIELEDYVLTDELTNRGKYIFPQYTLAPHAYVIVWASDRTTPFPGELHAPYKLDGEGETLWILSPNDEVVDTFTFGRQLDDISVGRPFAVETTTLVGPGDPGRYRPLAPGEAPPTNWAVPAYDASSWAQGSYGFGYMAPVTLAPGPEPAPGYIADLGAPLADSVAQWSSNGTQGANGWNYGYWLRSSDANGQYAATEFTQFPNNYFSNGAWDWPNGNPPWTYVGQTTSHPAGSGSVEHWVIRRWTAPQAGTVVLVWTIRKANNNGNGVSGHLYVDGAQLDSQTIAGNNQTGVTRVLSATVAAGSKVDLAHSPRGTNNSTDDGWDSSELSLRAWYVVGDSFVETELDQATGAGLVVRHAFTVDDLDAVGTLKLTLQVDDGAAVFINNLPVASLNASTEPAGTAPVDRLATDVGVPSVFRFAAIDAELAEGSNLLGVRAFDSAADDDTFAVNVTLEGEAVTVSDDIHYFTAPTPGEPNGPPADDLAPIIGDLTENPVVQDADAIVVRATVIATSYPIASVKLHWRTNFANEAELTMLDNGTAPDQVANDGVYTTSIPASASVAGDLVRWRVVATDTQARVSRWPEYLDPLDSDQYHGTVIQKVIVSNLQVMHTFLQSPDAAATESGTRATVWFRGELYDNVRFDLHGQSTASFPKKAFNVDFNDTQRFRWNDQYPRMKDINLLTNWADKTKTRNTLAYMTIGASGSGYHLAEPVRVERNGAFYALADMVEDGDDRWLERLGLDGEGALYKCYDSLSSVSQAEKKTRKDEAKDDLQAVIDVMNQGASTKSRWLWDNTDIPGMVSFAAQHVLISNHDCCHKNYYVYRDTLGTKEWVMLPWDVDLSFGHRWTGSQQYFDETVYWNNAIWVGDGNKLLGALYDIEDFQEMVLRRIRTLMDDFLQPPGTPEQYLWMEARMQEIADLIGADEDLDRAAWGSWGNQDTMQEAIDELFVDFFPDRREFLYDHPEIPDAQASDVTVQIHAWDASLAEPTQGWIRIRNTTSNAIDLSDARMSGDVVFNFRPGTVIAAGSDLYVVNDVNAFRARTTSPMGGERLFVTGPWTGTLKSSPSLTIVNRLGFTMASR